MFGDFDFEMEMVGQLETGTEPVTGTQNAQRLVQQDQVDYLVWAISSSVSQAVSDYASSSEVCYMSTSGAARITGEECQPYTSREVVNAYHTSFGQVELISQEELGSQFWINIADYAYGQLIKANVSSRVDQTDGREVVGNSWA